MRIALHALFAVMAVVTPSWAADDARLQRMALCQDSWLDWSKNNPAQMNAFRSSILGAYSQHDRDAYFVPKTAMSFAGIRILQVYPGSIGMAVGFSVLLDATFDKVQHSVEMLLGKPLKECSSSDNMHTCELEIAEQRTVTLMAEDSAKSTSTLVGCYYLYEK